MNPDAPIEKQRSQGDRITWVLIYSVWIILLAGAAVPSFFKAKTGKLPPPCRFWLRVIDGAKDQWVVENKATSGTQPTLAQVSEYMKHGTVPKCPQGGVYSINPVGEKPTCSIGGTNHSLPSDVIPNASTNGTNVVR